MATHSEYNDKTTATEVAAAFADQIKGRNVIVTGVSPASIGFTTVLAIASQAPANLVLASRTQSKLDVVVKDVSKKYPDVKLHTVLLDLMSMDSVRAAAKTVSALVPHIDVLINNAGISTPERLANTAPDGTTVDGQFLTNHLGVFLWTSLLLPRLRAAPASRIVNLTSQGHQLSPVRFSDYDFSKGVYDVPEDEKPREGLPPFFLRLNDGYPGFLGYGQSKSANILHATEMARRFRKRGDKITALSVHPGTIETELSRSLDQEGQETIAKTAPAGLWKTQDQGAATTLVAAFDPALQGIPVGDEGQPIGYLSDCQLRDDMVAKHAQGQELATRLWAVTETMLKHSVDL